MIFFFWEGWRGDILSHTLFVCTHGVTQVYLTNTITCVGVIIWSNKSSPKLNIVYITILWKTIFYLCFLELSIFKLISWDRFFKKRYKHLKWRVVLRRSTRSKFLKNLFSFIIVLCDKSRGCLLRKFNNFDNRVNEKRVKFIFLQSGSETVEWIKKY